MLVNLIMYVSLLILFELIITKNLIKSLILFFNNLIICGLICIFFIKLEVFGLTLILVYSSVFIIFLLFLNYFNEKDLKINYNFIFIIFSLFIFFFFKFYLYDCCLFNFFWINTYSIIKLKIIKFVSVLHVLIIKIFSYETLLINIYLVFGLICCVCLIVSKSYKTKLKLTFISKNKRVYRRTNSYNNFLNK